MKEELKALKNSTIQIVREKENLKKQKEFFNLKVEEKQEELSIQELFKEEGTSYEAAWILNYLFPQIQAIVASIRENHPKYGEKRIKELTVFALNTFMTENDYLMSFIEHIKLIVDNYFLYESCGFFKVLSIEDNIDELESTVKGDAESVLNESKEAAIKLGTSVSNIVKPYGEVAKSQLSDAKIATKKVVNKGSKKLIKILEEIENKTKSK